MKKILLIATLLFGLLNAQELNENNFNKVIKSNKLVLVKFWAPWCKPCKVLKPHFLKAKKIMGKKVLFAEYNVDLQGEPLRVYDIQTIPTMVLFKNGEEVDRNMMLSAKDIATWLSAYTK